VVGWTLLVGASCAWNLLRGGEEIEVIAPAQARASIDRDVLFALYHALLWLVGLYGLTVRMRYVRRIARERTRVEQELRNNLQLLDGALRQGDAAAYYRSIEPPRYDYIGDGIEAITGYRSDEITPDIWTSIAEEVEFLGDLAGCSPEEARSRFRAGAVDRWQSETKVRTKSGETRWAWDMSTARRGASGRIVGALGIVQDITERRQTEQALREREEAEHDFSEQLTALHEVTVELGTTRSRDDLCRLAVERGRSRLGFDRLSIWFVTDESSAIEGSFGVDEHGQIHDERGRRVPVSPDSVMGQILARKTQFHVATDTDLYNDKVQVVGRGSLAVAGLWDGETVIGAMAMDNLIRRERFTDRQCRLLALYASALGHLCTLKQTEERLRMLATAVEQSIDGIAVTAMDGVVQFINPAWAVMHGYDPPKLVDKRFDAFHTQEQVRQEVVPFNEEVKRSGACQGEVGHLRADGTTFPTWRSTTLLRDGAGESVGMIEIARDITESKEVDELVSNILQASGDALYVLDRDGTILRCNAEMAKLGGVPEEETVGAKCHELLPNDLCDTPDCPLERIMAGEPRVRAETVKRTSGGAEVPIEVIATPLKMGGQVVGAIGWIRDMAAHQEAEEALRSANAYSRSLLEVNLDPLVAIGPDGRVTDVNAATETATGRSRKALIGTEFSDYFTEPARARAGYEQAFRDGSVRDYTLAVRHRSGREMAVMFNASLYHDRAGKVAGVFAAARDISTIKQAEDRLRRQSDLLEAMNRMLRESLTCEADRDVARACLAAAEELTGSQFGFVCEANRDGRLDSLALSDPGWDACRIPKTDSVRALRNMEAHGFWSRVLKEERSQIVNDPSSHPDSVGTPEGHPQITSFLGVPLKRGDETIGVIGLGNKESGYTFDDQRQVEALSVAFVEALGRKRADEQLKGTAAELARSNTELKQYAYVASHDLQEPLRAVVSYLELLERRYKSHLDANARKFITRAVAAAARMRELIRDLLTYARVETRGDAPQHTDCATAVSSAVAGLKAVIEETGAVVTHGALPTVTADPTQLTQLFQNLVGNAIKFRRDEPPCIHVAVETDDESAMHLLESGIEQRWVFSVRDNGIGVEPQHARRIFAIFQRLHTRDEYPGTGIGLAICKRIVERHGGRIWLESELGVGSTFYFTIPHREGAEL